MGPTRFWGPFGRNKRVATLEILSVRNPCAPTESEVPRRSRSGFAVRMRLGGLGKCSQIFLAASKPLSAGIEMSRTATLRVTGADWCGEGFVRTRLLRLSTHIEKVVVFMCWSVMCWSVPYSAH
jgi:hypothetical protein